MIGHKRNCDL